MTILMIILNVVPLPSILILVRHRLGHKLGQRNIFHHMFQGYVNFTRILFTLSFISCIVCFVFGCLAYSNRERRIWYKTLGKTFQKSNLMMSTKFSIVFKSINIFKGWILIAISLVTLISLIIFPGKTFQTIFRILFLQKSSVGFLKHYPIYVNWFFGVGYGFGWAALCLNVRHSRTSEKTSLEYNFVARFHFHSDFGRRLIHSWSWSTKQKAFYRRKAYSYLRLILTRNHLYQQHQYVNALNCNRAFIPRSGSIQINVPSAFEFMNSAFLLKPINIIPVYQLSMPSLAPSSH